MRKREASGRRLCHLGKLDDGGESLTLAAVSLRMKDKAWILVGMMGVGKSTAGQLIAARTGREHFDTDRMLIKKLGRPIPQLFQMLGEPTFRDHETTLLREMEPGPYVLSTGGGIVIRPQNWVEMRRLGTTVFLDVQLEVLVRRLEASKKRRPLLQGGDVEPKVSSILAERMPLYRQADITVHLEDFDSEGAADRILEVLEVAI